MNLNTNLAYVFTTIYLFDLVLWPSASTLTYLFLIFLKARAVTTPGIWTAEAKS